MTTTAPATARPVIELLEYQRRDVQNPSRFCWCNWSRQVGKSFSKSLKRLLRGVERRRLQVLLSAGERQSRELMDKVRMHCQAMSIAADFSESTYFEGTSFKQLELRLPNGVRVLALPANPNTARGFTGDVLLDEFAMHQHDREIWAALYPTVMRGAGELDVCSTPKGRDNVFYDLSQNLAFDHSTVTILDAVRDGLDVRVDELRAGLGDEDLWRQEFLCEFLDQAESFLSYGQIAECEDPGIDPPVGLDGVAEVIRRIGLADGPVYVGIDVGRYRDLTVVWILERRDHVLHTIGIVAIRDVTFRTQWEQVVQPILSCSQVKRACIDSTGLGMAMGEAAAEAFGAWRVEPVMFSLQIKQELAGPLGIRVQDRTIRIPATPEIRNDWHSITRSPTATGAFRYVAERTPAGHADRFWAAALAVRASAEVAAWDGDSYSAGARQMAAKTDDIAEIAAARPAAL